MVSYAPEREIRRTARNNQPKAKVERQKIRLVKERTREMTTIIDIGKYYFLVEMGTLEWQRTNGRGTKRNVPGSIASRIKNDMAARCYTDIFAPVEYNPTTHRVKGIVSTLYFQKKKSDSGYDPFTAFWRFRFHDGAVELTFSNGEIAVGKEWDDPKNSKAKGGNPKDDPANYQVYKDGKIEIPRSEMKSIFKIVEDTEYYKEHELKYVK